MSAEIAGWIEEALAHPERWQEVRAVDEGERAQRQGDDAGTERVLVVRQEDKHARFRQVLTWRREGFTLQEIGDRLGPPRQRVQQIEAATARWEVTRSERVTATSPVEALHVARGALVGLRPRGIATVGQVAVPSDADLLSVRNVGPDTVTAIRADLAARYHAEG